MYVSSSARWISAQLKPAKPGNGDCGCSGPYHLPEEQRARYLAFRHGARTEVVEVTRVRAVHGADNYAEVELSDGRRLYHDKTLDRLETLLPSNFDRVHRSHIVNLDYVTKVQSLAGSRYRARLDSGTSVPVSRARIKELRRRLT